MRYYFLAGMAMAALLILSCSPAPPWKVCIEGQSLRMHIHSRLVITVDSKPLDIPASIGMEKGCTSPLHTHEANGIIHVESPQLYPYTLGHFFQVWGQVLTGEQVLEYSSAEGYKIRAMADGSPVTDLPRLELKDGQRITIAITSPTQT